MAAAFARTTRALASDSPRWPMTALAIGGLVLAAWLAWFLGASVSLYEVSQRARLEADNAARDVSPVQSGRLVASRLAIGRRVRAGDVLVELDATAQRLRLADAERRLAEYPSRLASLSREIEALGAADAGDQDAASAAARAAVSASRSRASAERAAATAPPWSPASAAPSAAISRPSEASRGA